MEEGGLFFSPFRGTTVNRLTRWGGGSQEGGAPPRPVTRSTSARSLLLQKTRGIGRSAASVTGMRMASALKEQASDSTASLTPKRRASFTHGRTASPRRASHDSTAPTTPRRKASLDGPKGVAGGSTGGGRTPSSDSNGKSSDSGLSFHSAVKAAVKAHGVQGGMIKKRMKEWASEGQTAALCKDMGRSLKVRKL